MKTHKELYDLHQFSMEDKIRLDKMMLAYQTTNFISDEDLDWYIERIAQLLNVASILPAKQALIYEWAIREFHWGLDIKRHREFK